MANYKISGEMIQAAQTILAKASATSGVGSVGQVHEIILRSEDANEDPEKFPLLHIVPIGPIIGFAITRNGEPIKDSDYIFVNAHALAAAIPAIGFSITAKAIEVPYIIDPK